MRYIAPRASSLEEYIVNIEVKPDNSKTCFTFWLRPESDISFPLFTLAAVKAPDFPDSLYAGDIVRGAFGHSVR